MKRIKKWKQIFIVIGTISVILLFFNWLMPADRAWREQVFIRVCYFIISIIFFVAALILDIVKGAVSEERNK